jgi:hypothetical protein
LKTQDMGGGGILIQEILIKIDTGFEKSKSQLLELEIQPYLCELHNESSTITD